MRLVIQRIKDILTAELSSLPTLVKLIDCRPNGWIIKNMNARNYPAIFIWPARDNISESQMPNVAAQSMKITITCLHHSSDPSYAAFNEDKGVFALNEAVLTVLAKNKKLKISGKPDVNVRGMRLPIDTQYVEREDGTTFVIGSVAMVEFFNHDVPW
ncbi:hypothetical protein LCGC14_2791780, partial [marine sediment metagenome]